MFPQFRMSKFYVTEYKNHVIFIVIDGKSLNKKTQSFELG